MILTYEQIKEFTYGAVCLTEGGDGITFSRMSERMRESFRPFGIMKCDATAGIQVEFMTDTPLMRIGYRNARPASGRSICLFDVLSDGVLCASFGEAPIEEGKGEAEISLPEGLHRVTIVFPNLATFTLAFLEIADGARVEKTKRPLKLLALGDSITQGYDARHPSMSYVNLLAEHFRAEAWNCGLGGARFSADTLDEEGLFAPDIVTVAYGTNDWSHITAEQLEENSRAYFSKLVSLYPCTRIFAILPLWRADAQRSEHAMGPFERCYEILGRVCRSYKQITLVNGMKLTPHHPDFYADKNLHPNEAGFLLYAKNLIAEIEKKQRSSRV